MIFNFKKHNKITFRQFWVLNTLNYLKKGGAFNSRNNNYETVDKYILDNFDLKNNKLEMTNAQITKGINKNRTKRYHLSTETISRAISKLKNIKILLNNQPFITKHRHGKFNAHPYLRINPILLPHGNLNDYVTLDKGGNPIKAHKINEIKQELKLVNHQRTKLTNKHKKLVCTLKQLRHA